jgi:hypothetical protein
VEHDEQFRAHLKAAAAGLEASGRACPASSDLVAHYRGELDPALREQIESHLMTCPACREKLRDVSEFFDAPRPDEQAIPPADLQREWGALWSRIEASTPPAEKHPIPFRRPAPRWMLALAACLIVGLSTTTIWSLLRQQQLGQLEAENRRLRQQSETDRQQVAQLQAPRLNTSIHDVFSGESLARSSRSGAINRVAVSDGTPFTLLLSGEGVRNFPDYAIEILDSQNRSVWRAQGLKRGTLGNFVITLNGSFLVPGEYRFRLFGKTDTGDQPITEYRVVISKLP